MLRVSTSSPTSATRSCRLGQAKPHRPRFRVREQEWPGVVGLLLRPYKGMGGTCQQASITYHERVRGGATLAIDESQKHAFNSYLRLGPSWFPLPGGPQQRFHRLRGRRLLGQVRNDDHEMLLLVGLQLRLLHSQEFLRRSLGTRATCMLYVTPILHIGGGYVFDTGTRRILSGYAYMKYPD